MAKKIRLIFVVSVLSVTIGCANKAPVLMDSGIGKDAITDMEMVYVKGGCYQMGNIFGDPDFESEFAQDEKPVHEVCVGDFYLGKYEVTQGQWKSIMGSNTASLCGTWCDCPPSGDNCPVGNVTWGEVQDFISRLNSRGGGSKYRLPTEAEWEYAARSGGKGEKYSGGNDVDSIAWYGKNSNYKLHPVGTKAPNGFGIYDMSGNVWEMTSDWYGSDYYKNSLRDNPTGPNNQAGPDIDHVVRGGCASGESANVRTTKRNYVFQSAGSEGRKWSLGFRLLRSP